MKIVFLIKSNTVDIKNFNLKNIPGSSGRLDVIARCILSALVENDKFDENAEIWVFLDRYGAFNFNPSELNFETFPKNEILLSQYLFESIQKIQPEQSKFSIPISYVKCVDTNIFEVLEQLLEDKFELFILSEDGIDLQQYIRSTQYTDPQYAFIVGSQTGDFIDSEKLSELNLQRLSLGKVSYLASSVIRLTKLIIYGEV